MALSRFEKDMQIIQALDDEPNDVGGMSSTELKATFDEGGEAVKEFLNGVLIPALDTYIARTDNPHAVTKAQVGLGNCDNTADVDKPVSAAQTAAIAVAKAEAVSAAAADATTKAAAAKAEAIAASDTLGAAAAAVLQHNTAESGVHATLFAGKLDKTGGTLTGPLTLNGAPTASLHAATKQYVDEVSAGVVLGQIPDGSITSEKLSGGVNTTLTVSTTHVGRTDNPHSVTAAQCGADPSGSAAAVQASLNAHTGRTDNPHGVTVAQIGAATAAALTAHAGRTDNPHGVTPAQIGAAKIASGSYVGTGTFGTGHPTSLSFPFEPKLLLVSGSRYGIFQKPYNDVLYNSDGFLWTQGTTAIPMRGRLSGGNYAYNYIDVALTQTTLSWSDASNGGYEGVSQCNELNKTYYYIAIG